MKRSDLNHLRRLVAWVRCEIGQTPDDLVETVRNLAERGVTVDSDAAAARMVQAHDAARSVPKYVRDAVMALEAYTSGPVTAVDEPGRPLRCVAEPLATMEASKRPSRIGGKP